MPASNHSQAFHPFPWQSSYFGLGLTRRCLDQRSERPSLHRCLANEETHSRPMVGETMAQSYQRFTGAPSPEELVLSPVETAILQAIAYSDIFDYPLTGPEIHRYLVGTRASWREIQGALAGDMLSDRLSSRSGFFLMRGRDEIVDTRRRRAAVAASMWPRAKRYASSISQLPFVRMVAVTGALAMDNVDPGTDIDYLIVTRPGRLWLCRALVVALVKLAARRGDVICPNFFLSERSLDLGEPNLFTAHELVQMVPLAGIQTYRRMCDLNSWAARYLPNAFDAPRRVTAGEGEPNPGAPLNCVTGDRTEDRSIFWKTAEAALRTPLGASLERWEMGRKVRKLSSQFRDATREGEPAAEINLSVDRCKGHFDNHQRRTLEAYSTRLQSLAVRFPQIVAAADLARGAL